MTESPAGSTAIQVLRFAEGAPVSIFNPTQTTADGAERNAALARPVLRDNVIRQQAAARVVHVNPDFIVTVPCAVQDVTATNNVLNHPVIFPYTLAIQCVRQRVRPMQRVSRKNPLQFVFVASAMLEAGPVASIGRATNEPVARGNRQGAHTDCQLL